MNRDALENLARDTMSSLAAPARPDGVASAEYLPPASRIRVSDELLAFAQERLLDGDAPQESTTRAERLQLRARVESFTSTLAHDPELRALPGHAADLDAVQSAPAEFVAVLMNDVLALGPLGPLLRDPDVTEVMVNGPRSVFFEMRNRRHQGRSFLNERQVRAVLGRLLGGSGFRLQDLDPVGEARLADGGHIQVALPPVAPEGPSFTIRRIPRRPPVIADLVAAAMLTPATADFLRACVRARVNVIVTGGSRAGKSLVLNALCNEIEPEQRVVVVENRWQLALTPPNRVMLQTSVARGLDLRRLIQIGIQMQPDRLVVGECAGAEVLDMLLAMSAGLEGSLTSAFASSPRDLVNRLLMFGHMAGHNLTDEALTRQIALSVGAIVHLTRRQDGLRVVSSISTVEGLNAGAVELSDVFVSGDDGTLTATGMVPRFHGRLERAGVALPADLYVAPRL